MKKTALLIIIALLLGCRPEPDKPVKITILPLGAYDANILDTLSTAIYQAYHMEVRILKEQALPNLAYNAERHRYRADSLLRWMSREHFQDEGLILGFTSNDISITKYTPDGNIKQPVSKYRDWGIFGLGERPGDASVVSTYRLAHKNKQTYTDRVIKVCLHEIGHNLGLPHCPNSGCVMEDAAETIKTIDRVEPGLCSDCERKILMPGSI